ncbi:MAG TPA: carboxypeptidase M32 [Urbifossiella sp.]|nr:carboxypeptidase M32 [Urbifossiella sp.]
MTAADSYAELVRRSKELGVLGSCAAVLGWDQQTYMPTNGAALRGEQMAFLAGLAHGKATDPKVGELLAAVEGSELTRDPESDPAANVRELRRGYDRATKLPAALVEELARVTTAAQQAWQQARAANDFPAFRPHLEKVVALKRQEAQAVGYTDHPYNALLDEYEPGATVAEVREVFAGLTRELVPLIKAIGESGKKPDRTVLERDFPVERQKVFAEGAAAAFGFDFASGRLDTTAHPFCSGVGPGDCRLTTRYNPRFFPEAFFGVLHETGHGLYEQNLPAEHFGTPVGAACSLGIHESQSRLWENQVGRGRPFWDHFFPRLRQTFPAAIAGVEPDRFYFAVNEVKPSLIRVEADEATYNLHVALRFEIELGLISGDLAVADLPGAWNERFKTMLGLDVPDDARGCLQDIHWSFGGLGYFPTYTLGNLYAAQLMAAARRDLSGLDDDFRRGEFGRLKAWLGEKVHRHGGRYRAGELCRRATGEALTAAPFLSYLNDKFAPLYGV